MLLDVKAKIKKRQQIFFHNSISLDAMGLFLWQYNIIFPNKLIFIRKNKKKRIEKSRFSKL
ncbi:hypothetical protein IE90_02795 [Sanguibacteroides justesenii]|uniref:Uncharacterized protein n=1 Tax=Sanguibacteroides justesenii TaxID=1547597 RepID=A0AB34R7Q4_9PORP|nr:hypothetical protein IE90_02795 [Sanguibacteroides justesenii]